MIKTRQNDTKCASNSYALAGNPLFSMGKWFQKCAWLPAAQDKNITLKCAEKMVASLASPPSRKVRIVFKKREKGKEDERRLKTQKRQKIERNILVHPSICFLVAHIDELTCRSRPSQKSWEQIQWVCRNGHSWRDGHVLHPSGHLFAVCELEAMASHGKPWPSSFDGLPKLFKDCDFPLGYVWK